MELYEPITGKFGIQQATILPLPGGDYGYRLRDRCLGSVDTLCDMIDIDTGLSVPIRASLNNI